MDHVWGGDHFLQPGIARHVAIRSVIDIQEHWKCIWYMYRKKWIGCLKMLFLTRWLPRRVPTKSCSEKLLFVDIQYLLLYYDIIRERSFQGLYTLYVINFLKFRIILFIISELIFFVSFFWIFFHLILKLIYYEHQKILNFFNLLEILLLNSFIFVTLGFTVTLSLIII